MIDIATVLSHYDDFNVDGAGVAEIEYLRPMPFEEPSKVLDGSERLVLVLVESRVLQPIEDAQLSTADLVTRIQTFKYDLIADSYDAYCIEARLYGQDPTHTLHQDSLTILALREFLREVRDACPQLQGVILVGNFPDAAIGRSWWAIDAGNGPTKYAVGFADAGQRADVVLADLDGRWELVNETDTKQHPSGGALAIDWFTPSSESRQRIVTSLGPRTRLTLHASNVKATKYTPIDLFMLRDASYTIVNDDPLDFTIQLYVSERADGHEIPIDANTELAVSDKSFANPIPRPEIYVSRINARNVALSPPPGFLDAAGRPQTVVSPTIIDLLAEKFWRHDASLERALLAEYFDRNHAFRSGVFEAEGLKIAEISHGYWDGGLSTSLDVLSTDRAPSIFDAKLLDWVSWLKTPAFFRLIEAHASRDATFFGASDPADIRVAAGGEPPWQWTQTQLPDGRYQYTPSYDDMICNASYELHRTLWANGVLKGVMPSVFLHTGCDSTSPAWGVDCWNDSPTGGNVQPYNGPWYGRQQNAETILFYLNGLALLGRAKTANDAPDGFADAYNNSDEACFGSGWKEYFERDAANTALGGTANTCDRKRTSMWCVVGDWTLRKRYHALSADLFEPNDSFEAATPVTLGESWSASLTLHTSRDVDYFDVRFPKPATHAPVVPAFVRFANEWVELHSWGDELRLAITPVGAFPPARLSVYDASRRLLAQGTSEVLEQAMLDVAQGQVYLAVDASTSGRTRYELTMTYRPAGSSCTFRTGTLRPPLVRPQNLVPWLDWGVLSRPSGAEAVAAALRLVDDRLAGRLLTNDERLLVADLKRALRDVQAIVRTATTLGAPGPRPLRAGP